MTLLADLVPALSTRSSLDELAEDLLTAWVPDVAGGADFAAQTAAPTLDSADVARIVVPRPDGPPRVAHPLSVRALSLLRAACAPIAPAVDALLAPTVCGYRAGAEAGSAYSAEFHRYRDLARGLSDDATHVLAVDVCDFFASADTTMVADRLATRFGADATRDVAAVLAGLRTLGVRGLAAGYADMRMLANVLLADVDAVIDRPFVRWVDDYRIFLRSPDDAPTVLAAVDAALAEIGLELNPAKTRLWPAEEAARTLFARQFASVYHPDVEAPEMVRAALRGLFIDAVGQETVRRRELRYALPRLAETGDDVAVEFCCTALPAMPWEAPRFVQYLTTFAPVRPDLAGWAAATLRSALAEDDIWLTARLTPLAARVHLDAATLDAVAAHASATCDATLWGQCVRLLGVHGRATDVRELVADTADERAAVAALLDLGEPVPARLRAGLGAMTAAAAGGSPLPAPSAESLL